jgi:putative hydrolase of the HAD superfamily
MRKPDLPIYRLTLDRLRLEARECLFIDDVEVNCEAARELGMSAVRFSSTAQALDDMTELLRERGSAGAPDAERTESGERDSSERGGG